MGVRQVAWSLGRIGKIISPHCEHQRDQHNVHGDCARCASGRRAKIARSSGHDCCHHRRYRCCRHRHHRRGVRDWDCGSRRSPLRQSSSSSSPPGGQQRQHHPPPLLALSCVWPSFILPPSVALVVVVAVVVIAAVLCRCCCHWLPPLISIAKYVTPPPR